VIDRLAAEGIVRLGSGVFFEGDNGLIAGGTSVAGVIVSLGVA
jgi:hypothetical protein